MYTHTDEKFEYTFTTFVFHIYMLIPEYFPTMLDKSQNIDKEIIIDI